MDPNLGGSFIYGVPWAPMDPKFGLSLVYGVPWAIWTLNLGYALVYGMPCAPIDPKFGVSLIHGCLRGPEFGVTPRLWRVLSPYGPQIWGTPSFIGCPGPL